MPPLVRFLRLATLLGVAPLAAPPAHGQEVSMEARVVAVRDGDTLEVERSGSAYSLDVAEIDCPELAQPFGAEARRVTLELVDGTTIRIGLRGMPGGARLVGSVRLPDGRDLAAELLRRGLAWWIGGTDEDGGSDALRTLERQARAAERGLWSQPEPVPPWTFRGEPIPPALRPRERQETAPPSGSPRPPSPIRSGCIPRSQCCRVCVKGKACGNSCINVSLNCHKGRGCACNSYEICA